MVLESSSYDVMVSPPLGPHSQHAGHEAREIVVEECIGRGVRW
jgi:hypothetical protein